MTVIEHEQGSEAWKQWRMSRITATDISIILDSNPFKTKLELWEEKLGFRQPTQLNSAMKRGQVLEPEARKLASELLEMEFDPCVLQHDSYSWLAASLDGLVTKYDENVSGEQVCFDYILEIKCPKGSTHDDALDCRIPKYYRDQMQTQLLVSGAEICYYFSYRPERKDKPFAIIEVFPDKEKQAEIIEKGYEFYIQMCTMQPPEEWKLNKK